MEPPPSRIPRRWTADEDSTLRAEATYQLIAAGSVRDWNRIASKLPGRMNKDCRKRWSKISENVKKGNWDPVEDTKLRDAVKAVGTRWTQVAEMVGTRHADQCAKRWTQCLDPLIDHSDWREAEDNRLLAEVAAAGRNWRKIAELFPGRTKLALKNRYTALRRKLQARQARANHESPPSAPDNAPKLFRIMTDDTLPVSDETPSSEEEICASMCSTRPPSRSSSRSEMSRRQTLSFSNMVVETSSGLATPAGHHDSGELFHFLPPTPSQHYSFHHRGSLDHHMLDPSNFAPVGLSSLSEPMLTPRSEYLPGSMLDSTFPLHSSSVPNEWLTNSTSIHNLSGFRFPESFDMSPLSSSSTDRQYPPQHTPLRRTTIVLENIEETTLSKVMSILIQEKAKVRMETTHSEQATEQI